MMMKQNMRHLLLAAATAGALLAPATASLAQSLFAPVIKVDDQVITRFELEQRIAFLATVNTPGDLEKLAREQLIDDRLKEVAARTIGANVTNEAIQEGLAQFASRGDLTPEEFLQLMAQEGIDKETVLAFVRSGLLWRQVVGARFASRVSVNEADIDRAMDALGSRASVQVLLSEAIIPLQPGYEAQITEIAEQVAQINDFAEFAEAAKRYSAAQTRDTGGKLGWLPINRLPEPLRPVLLGLEPGETSAVIPMQGALAVFQMRAIGETPYRAAPIAAIEYATLALPGGRSPETLAEAERIADTLDTCDDLYGENFGQPAERLSRQTLAPGALPSDIATELAKLDAGEISTTLTRAEDGALLLLMMCGRTPELTEDISREDVALRLRNEQLEGFADGYLDELRSEARIVQK